MVAATIEPATACVRVMIVDDHPLVRQGLAYLIDRTPDLKTCAQVADSGAALTALEKQHPDVAVVDLSLRGASGLDLIKELRRRQADLPVLVLTMHDEAFYAERALRAGARGYVVKGEEPDEVLDAIRSVFAGGCYVSRKVASDLVLRAAAPAPAVEGNPVEKLSDRELEVFELVGRGLTTREIAERLFVSVKTVETHRHRIKEKLGFRSGIEAMRYAIKWVETSAATAKPASRG